MRNFIPGLHEGVDVRTYVRTIFSEPKFLECIDNQIFLPFGAPLRVLRYYDKNIQYFESKQQMRYPWVIKNYQW